MRMASAAFLVGLLFFYSRTTLSPVDIALVGLAVLALIVAVRERGEWVIPHHPQELFVAVFAIFVSARFLAWSGDNKLFLLKTLYLIAAYAAIRYFSQKEESADFRGSLMNGYALGATLSACAGVIAYAILVVNPSSGSIPFFWSDGIRLSGLFDDPVVYGAFLAPALLVLFYRFEIARDILSRIALAIAVGAVYINLILTGSRGAWLNALVAVAVCGMLIPEARRAFLSWRAAVAGAIFLAAAFLVVFVVPVRDTTYYAATLQSRATSSDAPRFETWRASPALFADRPVPRVFLGSGGGSFPLASSRKLDAHNVYLKTLYEYGVFGFALIVGFFFFAAREVVRRARESPLFAIVAASLAGIAAQGMFVDVLHWRHLWLLAGLA